ncbi:fe2+ transport protein [Halococcus saccharolyticus DSM 5350]|uniref:Fe2+ transport protein n=1 Tax=Halococcus saccharolyticus DSM 5350 TaxID=1227455 RepID=M0MKT2_9EURY|nr:fe2+ transport protein [Halococcus saccharolyticus DSM 5350]
MAAGTAATAGCLETLGLRTQSAWRDPPLVNDRPRAVYYPAVTEGMAMYGTRSVGPYTVALMYSYPHRFWNLDGSQTRKTVVESEDSVHLMTTIWDERSGIVIPVDAGLSAEIVQDGELVSQEVIYPMLSQRMGFHYGANFRLDGNGTYEARVSIGGTRMRRTGRFEEEFSDPMTATFEFTFDTAELYDLALRQLPEKQGERGAVEPMDMGMDVPVGRAPPKRALPGTRLGTKRSGDATFVVTAIRNTNGATRLAVFPRTPYNRIVLPFMSLSATVSRGGKRVFDGSLERTLDPDVGYHYSTAVEGIQPGDELEISVITPPQIARHDGYETAFIHMPPVEMIVPSSVTT